MIENKDPQYKFRYSERLHHKKDFERVFKSGRKIVHPAIFIYCCSNNTGSGKCRLGLVTSSKIGNAVKRNLVKRRLREIFRLNKNALKPGTDIIFIPKQLSVKADFHKLREIVLSLFNRAGLLKKIN